MQILIDWIGIYIFQSGIKGREEFRDKVRVLVFSASFNNISVISWRSFFFCEEYGVPGEILWGEEYTMRTNSYAYSDGLDRNLFIYVRDKSGDIMIINPFADSDRSDRSLFFFSVKCRGVYSTF